MENNLNKELLKSNLLFLLRQTREQSTYLTLREIANILLEAYSDEIPLLIKEFTSDEINEEIKRERSDEIKKEQKYED